MSQSEKEHHPNQDTKNAQVEHHSELDVIGVGYADTSSDQKEASLSQDKLDQVADNVNAVIDQDQPKWETEQDWNDTALKIWLS